MYGAVGRFPCRLIVSRQSSRNSNGNIRKPLPSGLPVARLHRLYEG